MATTDGRLSLPIGPIRRGIWPVPIAGIVPTIIFTLRWASPNSEASAGRHTRMSTMQWCRTVPRAIMQEHFTGPIG